MVIIINKRLKNDMWNSSQIMSLFCLKIERFILLIMIELGYTSTFYMNLNDSKEGGYNSVDDTSVLTKSFHCFISCPQLIQPIWFINHRLVFLIICPFSSFVLGFSIEVINLSRLYLIHISKLTR
jgi:hypothetical protein